MSTDSFDQDCPDKNDLLSQLRFKVSKFPRSSGVYLMRDQAAQVIYVGKAKSLRERVRSYFNGQDERSQIQFLMRKVVTIETIVTETEQQAFILERDLITKYKPRYNIRLKDDKAYISIRLDENVEWPRLELVRKIHNDGARYFGPYTFGHELRTLLEVIKRVVPLRTCADTVFYNRQRPCLEYQIKRCAGPCCLAVDKTEYRAWVKQARAILEGRVESLLTDFNQRMEKAAAELRFEDAAQYRDRVATLSSIKQGQKYISSSGEDRDVFAFYRDEQFMVVTLLKVRLGRIADSHNFRFEEVAISSAEVLEACLSQYYENSQEVPDEIIVPLEIENASLIESRLKDKSSRKIEITVPKQGLKSRLLGLAELNAKEHYGSLYDSANSYVEVAKRLALLFKLKQFPRKIECIDISNLQGSDIVGALVCFFDGLPSKESYRKYKISQQGKPDDFNSIYEVVYRRLKSGLEQGDLPDLLVIDGGLGQLSKAIQAREELKLSLEIVALAKERSSGAQVATNSKPERVFLEGAETPIVLQPGEASTNLLVRLRDETHRFVITFHRSRRAKRQVSSKLDDIPGLTAERKRRLLKIFGSLEQLKSQPQEEVARKAKIPLWLVQKIVERI